MFWKRKRPLSDSPSAEDLTKADDIELLALMIRLARPGHQLAAQAEMMRRTVKAMRSATWLAVALLVVAVVQVVLSFQQPA